MITRTLNLEKDWGFKIDVCGAQADFNPLWIPAKRAILDPYALAIRFGKMKKERATQIEADLYAEACIMGSPTPGYDVLTKAQWSKILQTDEILFSTLRGICDLRVNFDPDAEVRADGHDAPGVDQPEPASEKSAQQD